MWQILSLLQLQHKEIERARDQKEEDHSDQITKILKAFIRKSLGIINKIFETKDKIILKINSTYFWNCMSLKVQTSFSHSNTSPTDF